MKNYGDNKVKQITLVWACTETGRKLDSQRVLYRNLETSLKVDQGIDGKMK
jgi:hypothetical protein